MTTGNDPALKPDGQQPVVAPTDPTGQQPAANGGDAGKLTFTHPQPAEQDADDVVLAKLLEEAQAEEAASGQKPNNTAEGQDPATGAPGAPKDQQQAGQQPPAGKQTIMVPKERLDSVLSERDQLREQNAFLRGKTEALQRAPAQQPGQQQQQQQPPTPEQRLAEIQSKTDVLAKRFDDGDLTMADLKREERALIAEEQAIREDQLAARLKPATAAPAPQGDPLYLDTLTDKLEKDHPWVAVFDQFAQQSGNEADWDYLTQLAKGNLVGRGVNLKAGTDLVRYQLRKEIAVLADEYGPKLLGDRAKALGIALPGTQVPNGQQQPQPLSPQAQARKVALEKAAGAPPDLANLNGTIGDPTGAMTEERLETLSEDEFDKMPAAVRNKLLGVSP